MAKEKTKKVELVAKDELRLLTLLCSICMTTAPTLMMV